MCVYVLLYLSRADVGFVLAYIYRPIHCGRWMAVVVASDFILSNHKNFASVWSNEAINDQHRTQAFCVWSETAPSLWTHLFNTSVLNCNDLLHCLWRCNKDTNDWIKEMPKASFICNVILLYSSYCSCRDKYMLQCLHVKGLFWKSSHMIKIIRLFTHEKLMTLIKVY